SMRDRHLYNWWRSLMETGCQPELEVLEIVPSGSDWIEAEQFWIAYYRFIGCDLVNLCDGGQGTVGIRFSDLHIERLRAAHVGKKRSQESIVKSGLGSRHAWRQNPGSRWKPDTLRKMLITKAERRAAGMYRKRRPATEETKAKIRAAKLGKKLSPEHCAKLSEARRRKSL
ncbi:hypothetical protein K7461_29235, partial [Pseudomonas fluorescens]|uniref:NUMOD3 domain-containing DNA-binding protein n=1 Tax=Pseudomonas fluorescens TaxID=294 RepID=UPI001CA6E5CD